MLTRKLGQVLSSFGGAELRVELLPAACWLPLLSPTVKTVSRDVVLVHRHPVSAEVLLEEDGGVLVDLVRHLLLVGNTGNTETVKLDKLLQHHYGGQTTVSPVKLSSPCNAGSAGPTA